MSENTTANRKEDETPDPHDPWSDDEEDEDETPNPHDPWS